MKLTKEVNLKGISSMTLKYGTTNRIDPKVVFFSGKAWFKPNYDGDYKESIKYMNHRIGKFISKRILSDTNFDSHYICDIDLKSTNLIFNKSKYFTFDCFLRQSGNKPVKDIFSCVESVAKDTVSEITDVFIENGFTINNKK